MASEDPALVALTDQEGAALRELLADWPAYFEMMTSPSAWGDGARLALVDCLVYRSDPDRMLARMWAWVHLLEKSAK